MTRTVTRDARGVSTLCAGTNNNGAISFLGIGCVTMYVHCHWDRCVVVRCATYQDDNVTERALEAVFTDCINRVTDCAGTDNAWYLRSADGFVPSNTTDHPQPG